MCSRHEGFKKNRTSCNEPDLPIHYLGIYVVSASKANKIAYNNEAVAKRSHIRTNL